MNQHKLSATAQQMLSLLNELPPGTGYRLTQLGEHIGTGSSEELENTSAELEVHGYIKVIRAEGIAEPLAFLISKDGNGDGAPKTQKEKSIISDTRIDFFSAGSASPKRTDIPANDNSNNRGPIRLVTSPGAKAPERTQPGTQPTALEEITIKQILNALSHSIENAIEIPPREKWPIVDKIDAITAHPSLQKTLAAPIKRIVE